MMINEKTKVSDIIKADKSSIDALASLSKPLSKLKNPILRKVMASRVTLSEAAKMGGVTLEAIAAVLTPLGFQFESKENEVQTEALTAPDWMLHLEEDKIHNFDVRALLADGSEPLKEIMAKFKTVPEGEALCIIVNFEPVPLINMLQKKGTVQCYTQQVSPIEFHTYFYKLPKAQQSKVTIPLKGKAGAVVHDSEADFLTLCQHFEKENIVTVDVRALEMPGPRLTILKELEQLKADRALYVFHKRIPVYLLEDLAEMSFEVHICAMAETDVRMLLFKAS